MYLKFPTQDHVSRYSKISSIQINKQIEQDYKEYFQIEIQEQKSSAEFFKFMKSDRSLTRISRQQFPKL